MLHSSLEKILPADGKATMNTHSNMISVQAGDSTRMWESSSGQFLYALQSHHPVVFSHNAKQAVVFNGNEAEVYYALSGQPVLVELDERAKKRGVRTVK